MKRNLFPSFLLLLLAIGCSADKGVETTIDVIPQPQKVLRMEGDAFDVKGAPIAILTDDENTRNAVLEFAEALRTATGLAHPIVEKAGEGIVFAENKSLAEEAYTININKKGVRIEAAGFPGFFYGLQTLKQLLPAELLSGKPAPGQVSWKLQPLKIEDRPRFAYRGMHLDCARHFFSIDEVKKYIDAIALFKMNRFHWHLTEDQGWRIEIKKYPRLTEVGAWRDGTCIGKDFNTSDGIRYGGYYTQEQMKEIVAYAAARSITVIPELDLPGHMLAALASYPELGCTGGPYKVWQRWGITSDILCAGNEKVYEFLEGVLDEICEIFPSEYIHIGGDECFLTEQDDPWDHCPKCIAKMEELGIERGPAEKHYLQNYVTARIQSYLQGKGRKVIGWDEILEGDLAPGATIMSWRGTEGGIKAAEKGFDAIMSPYTYLYLDYYQSHERDKEPFCIGGYLPVENVYAYEPLEGISPEAQKHILGVQANLWTEYVTSDEILEYALLPRMCAASEIQWCNADRKDWDRFNGSLDHIFDILDAMGYTVCHDVRGEIGLDRIPARSAEELEQYRNENHFNW